MGGSIKPKKTDLKTYLRNLYRREKGDRAKPFGNIKVALIYPNTYSVGMSNLGFARIFDSITAALPEGATVMYLAENKAWERALNFAFHREKKLKTVAVLHTSLPLLLLSFFDYKDDLKEPEGAPFAIPRPDYTACNGRIPLELFRKTGWDDEKAFLWFALRYQHLKAYLGENISWRERQNRILVVLSTIPRESQELLFFVHRAFRDAEKNCQIIIKEHYHLPAKFYMKRLKMDFDRERFVFSNEDLNKTLRTVKAAIVTGSSVALESLALGCPVIIPRLASVVDMNPLSGVSDLPIYVDSPRILRGTAEDIIKRPDSPLSFDKRKRFIEDYFEFFDSERDLLERIEKLQ